MTASADKARERHRNILPVRSGHNRFPLSEANTSINSFLGFSLVEQQPYMRLLCYGYQMTYQYSLVALLLSDILYDIVSDMFYDNISVISVAISVIYAIYYAIATIYSSLNEEFPIHLASIRFFLMYRVVAVFSKCDIPYFLKAM